MIRGKLINIKIFGVIILLKKRGIIESKFVIKPSIDAIYMVDCINYRSTQSTKKPFIFTNKFVNSKIINI